MAWATGRPRPRVVRPFGASRAGVREEFSGCTGPKEQAFRYLPFLILFLPRMGANHNKFEKDILGSRRKNPAMNAITPDPSVRRPDYKLSDNLWARQGAVFI